MSRALLLYEDPRWRGLRPLTDLTPVPALAFGASDLATRWLEHTGATLLDIEARPAALAAWSGRPPAAARREPGWEVLVVNAAALPGPWTRALSEGQGAALWTSAGRIAAARLPYRTLEPGLERGEGFESFIESLGIAASPVEARFISRPWDLMAWNAEAIAEDLAGMTAGVRGEVDARAALIAPERIAVEAGARIEALAVLDARGGPIRIGRGARVAPHTVVTGPCAVGERTELLGGSIARSTFGPECRVAGEVEESVWQGYANKRHHGFVGHSVVGEWVNLGALTTTSDLKNNYGRVRSWVDGAEEDSGTPKLGAMIGPHVKTGIGTLLPTGASLGTGSQLFGGGRFAPKRVPSFGWWDGERMEEHRLAAFLDTARIAMSRRGRALEPADEALLRATFEQTAGERHAAARTASG